MPFETEEVGSMIHDAELDSSTFKTYEGNCHCGAFRFAIHHPKLEELNKCDCSICFMNGFRGLIWFNTPGVRKFEWLKGDEKDLKVYKFCSGELEHKFCPDCGTNLFARQESDGMQLVGINAMALADFEEIESTAVARYKGAAERLPQYKTTKGEPGKWKGDEKIPEGEVEYQGHCHCGNIRYVVRTKPLDECDVSACNCSWCFKSGMKNIYIPRTAIQFRIPIGASTFYTFKSQDGGFPVHCNTCATDVFVDCASTKTDGSFEPAKFVVLNVRTIELQDGSMLTWPKLEALKLKKFDGRAKPPKYEGQRLVEDNRRPEHMKYKPEGEYLPDGLDYGVRHWYAAHGDEANRFEVGCEGCRKHERECPK